MTLKILEALERAITKLDRLFHKLLLAGLAFIVLFPVGYVLFLMMTK